MTKPQLPNLQQNVANTILTININNSNNLNKFWVAIFTCQSHNNQVYSKQEWVREGGTYWQAFPMIGLGSDKNVFSKKKIVMKWSEMARNLFLRISATNHGFCFDLSCKYFFLSTSFFSFFLLLLHRYSSFPPPNVFLSLKHFFFPFKI